MSGYRRRVAKTMNEAIAGAMRAVEADVPVAMADPTRPVYHFLPPAGYQNDPNGLIRHDGYFHMFYQAHPFTHGRGKGGPIFWGHARSPDLVRWEHLPMAIWPSTEHGEQRCASGSVVIGRDGQPMIFYTSMGERIRQADAPDQWAALGDKDLIVWRKHPANPVLTGAAHGDLRVSEWRDPFVFRDGEAYYMLVGGRAHRGDQALGCVTIYRALDHALTRWQFLNVLYEWPDPGIRCIECPNLFRFGDAWVLFFSYTPPPTQVAYLIGTLDEDTFTFRPDRRGELERSPMGMYAPQAMRDERGRVILFGWVRPAGWRPGGGHGWCGCMTLPRVLSLDVDGCLRQEPAEELRTLRGRHHEWRDLVLHNAGRVLDGVRGDALEIVAEFEPVSQGAYGFRVRRSADGQRAVEIRCDGDQVQLTGADPTGLFDGARDALAGADYHVPLPQGDGTSAQRLHLLIDKCVLELYVDRKECITRAIYPPLDDLGVEVFADEGRAVLRSLDIWEMKPAW
jgi:beta-fructofuranosidase